MDYSLFYRRSIPIAQISKQLGSFDVFVSAFNSSDRVKQTFASVNAEKKIWLVHPEYLYTQIERPTGCVVVAPTDRDEKTQIEELIAEMPNIDSASICIDITGFMRHTLAFLLPKLESCGVKAFTALYTEPVSYSKQEATQFATTTSDVVRTIRGMYKSPGTGQNHLLIAVGYDHQLISLVFNY